MSEEIKDIIKILELSKEEIENNDENIIVTLDLQDLKSLKNLYDLYSKEKEENKKLRQCHLRYMNADEMLKELEEFIKDYETDYNVRWYVGYDTIQAIENLIKGYKELEEIKQQKLDKYLYKNQWICKDLAENYIHKSKIRKKIEEYEELVKDFEEYWSKDPRQFKKEKCVDYYKIEALKELLQEGDK